MQKEMIEQKIEMIKGIHPGVILDRELQKRNLPSSRFAMSIGEYPQTISAIINRRRGMNTRLSLKIEKELNIEEGFFMTLQVFHDIEEIKKELSSNKTPNIEKLNPLLFWDTKIENIEWNKNREFVIRRIMERGSESDIKEITSFYGKQLVKEVIESSDNLLPTAEYNLNKYIVNE